MVIALAAPPSSVVALPSPPRRPGPVVRCAADVATAYDHAIAAYWRGEPTSRDFTAWLDGYRRPSVLVPVGPPAAISVHGGGGTSIAWYDAGPVVIGCVPGQAGGYWIPRGAPLVSEPHLGRDGRRS